ncbi:hypothetical protein PtB15_15B149 [Puccinia triticina]|nr:hypothetical protein PtB15_15B149 [Puccinia triticina]
MVGITRKPNSPIYLIESNTADILEFEIGMRLGDYLEYVNTAGDNSLCYEVKLKGPPQMWKSVLDTITSRSGRVYLGSPCLVDFGHSLATGEFYIINGDVKRNFDGINKWNFNPLLAKKTTQIELAFRPKPLSLVGIGSINRISSIWDDEKKFTAYHEVVVNHTVGDCDMHIIVKVLVLPADMPENLKGSYIPGSQIGFSGLVIDSGGSDENIVIVATLRETQPTKSKSKSTHSQSGFVMHKHKS